MSVKKKLVYVAGPISKGDRLDNIMRAHDAGIVLLKAGLAVIVPHGSCFWGNKMQDEAFVLEPFPANTTYADWMGCDLEIVRRCDAVLRLRGESVGADMEVEEATKNGIPVFVDTDELIRWSKE